MQPRVGTDPPRYLSNRVPEMQVAVLESAKETEAGIITVPVLSHVSKASTGDPLVFERIIKGFVYILSDPRDEEIRYVGSTLRPKARLRAHIATGRNYPRTKLQIWIADLLRDGVQPMMGIVAIVIMGDLQQVEYAYCCKLRRRGARLLTQPNANPIASRSAAICPPSDRRCQTCYITGGHVYGCPER